MTTLNVVFLLTIYHFNILYTVHCTVYISEISQVNRTEHENTSKQCTIVKFHIGHKIMHIKINQSWATAPFRAKNVGKSTLARQ